VGSSLHCREVFRLRGEVYSLAAETGKEEVPSPGPAQRPRIGPLGPLHPPVRQAIGLGMQTHSAWEPHVQEVILGMAPGVWVAAAVADPPDAACASATM
jgi:hypothetical protein